MQERTTGFVLRIHPFTESSLIVNWLTAEHGRISTIAKGARRPKSASRGKLDVLYQAEISFTPARRGHLHVLSEVRVLDSHPAFRTNLHLLQQAAYCAHLIEQTTETDTPFPDIHALFADCLGALVQAGGSRTLVLAFELKLLSELGLAPDTTHPDFSTALGSLVRGLVECDWRAKTIPELSEIELKQLRQFLHGFLIYHLGKFPKSRAAALQTDD